ncbi:hypothetical protein CASFOL_034295 [Castilleja foliolosa]|uniref:Protein-serine/threonine phosphatase n=1 Tax=Castilleja foliolosa TaxID=1961234 RepID=A0ABD3BWZ6_9LAMI
MLDDFMLSLNTEIGDGSSEEKKMMVMHEECSEGNFDSIKKLKDTNVPSVSYNRQLIYSSFFGVYDGHGANYAKLEGIHEQYARLETIVEQMRMSQQGQSTPTDEQHPTRSSSTDDES